MQQSTILNCILMSHVKERGSSNVISEIKSTKVKPVQGACKFFVFYFEISTSFLMITFGLI